MINERMTRAVDRLLTDERLMVRFRRKPAKAVAQYRLRPEEVEALQDGDLRGLLERGLDPKVAFRKPISRPLFASMLSRFGGKVAPAAFLTMALALFPVSTAFADDAVVSGRVRRARVGPNNLHGLSGRLRATERHLRALRGIPRRTRGDRASFRLMNRRTFLRARQIDLTGKIVNLGGEN